MEKMKTTITILFLMFVSSIAVAGNVNNVPECKFSGTRSEGWYLGDKLIKYDNCERKLLECLYRDTRSEGWYSSKVMGDMMLVDYSFCSNESIKPTCRYSGTRSEGWYIDGEHIMFDTCSDRRIGCFYPGSRSEGWYAFERSEPELIVYDVGCSYM
jgi:hypothetical protein